MALRMISTSRSIRVLKMPITEAKLIGFEIDVKVDYLSEFSVDKIAGVVLLAINRNPANSFWRERSKKSPPYVGLRRNRTLTLDAIDHKPPQP